MTSKDEKISRTKFRALKAGIYSLMGIGATGVVSVLGGFVGIYVEAAPVGLTAGSLPEASIILGLVNVGLGALGVAGWFWLPEAEAEITRINTEWDNKVVEEENKRLKLVNENTRLKEIAAGMREPDPAPKPEPKQEVIPRSPRSYEEQQYLRTIESVERDIERARRNRNPYDDFP